MPETIHKFFGLSYAHYLVIPRSVLQSMPEEWQLQFVAMLEELNDTIDWEGDGHSRYRVELESVYGVHGQDRSVKDPFQDYERGRRRIEHKKKIPAAGGDTTDAEL